MATDRLILNTTQIDHFIRDGDLKKDRIAEQVGVDPKTFGRWLTGEVVRVGREEVKRLAEILGCPLTDITAANESLAFASSEEQKAAARLIEQENLVEILRPIDRWPLLEGLMNSIQEPELPLPVLGRLYNHLSIAAWRQSKIDSGEIYAKKALELGERLGSLTIIASAKNNLATIASFKGDLSTSIALYQYCIEHQKYLEEEHLLGAALSNLGAVYHEYGDLDKAIEYQNNAIEAFNKLGRPLNLAIAWFNMFLIYMEIDDLTKAESACDEGETFAKQAGFSRGQCDALIFRADLAAKNGLHRSAEKLYKEGVAGFSNLGIDEPTMYTFGARISRLAGNFRSAKDYITKGLSIAEQFPIERAALYVEQWKLGLAMGDESLAKTSLDESTKIYSECGARGRLHRLRLEFSSS